MFIVFNIIFNLNVMLSMLHNFRVPISSWPLGAKWNLHIHLLVMWISAGSLLSPQIQKKCWWLFGYCNLSFCVEKTIGVVNRHGRENRQQGKLVGDWDWSNWPAGSSIDPMGQMNSSCVIISKTISKCLRTMFLMVLAQRAQKQVLQPTMPVQGIKDLSIFIPISSN